MPKKPPKKETTEMIQDYFEENPSKSLREAEEEIGIPRATVIFANIWKK